MTEMDVRYEGLSLKNGRQTVFAGLNLQIPAGKIACFYGPTRSGKTSLLLATGGYLKPAEGEVWLGDFRVRQAPMRARRLTGLGVIPEFNPLLDNLTLRENLLFQGKLYGVAQPARRAQELIEQFDLRDEAECRAEDLGQRETLRAGIAMALVHDPAVLLVDEPGHALTTQELLSQWKYLERLKEAGKTILVTSHSLWVAQLADIPLKLPQGKEMLVDEFTAVGLPGDQTALA